MTRRGLTYQSREFVDGVNKPSVANLMALKSCAEKQVSINE
jgi:hypothetical protein